MTRPRFVVGDRMMGVHVPIGGNGTGRIYGQTDAHFTFTAVAASAVSYIEGDRYEIAQVQHLDVVALFDHFARDLMAQN
jgi:hypothetical protein